jgi:hypothetical protein
MNLGCHAGKAGAQFCSDIDQDGGRLTIGLWDRGCIRAAALYAIHWIFSSGICQDRASVGLYCSAWLACRLQLTGPGTCMNYRLYSIYGPAIVRNAQLFVWAGLKRDRIERLKTRRLLRCHDDPPHVVRAHTVLTPFYLL